MPADLNDTFLITVTSAPELRRTDLVLSGDVDMAALPLLADAVNKISGASSHTVVVHLGAVTYGGSTLANFLARVHRAAPPGSALLLCQPTPMIRTILRVTNMAQIATIRDDACV